jgi:bifunctional non-homologous end joining protein LigD
LVLAVRAGREWIYVGRVGTGFDQESLDAIHSKLKKLVTSEKPIAARVPDERWTTWVRPSLVAEVRFTEWTDAGEMRHPVFLGLRDDKVATDVVRERSA